MASATVFESNQQNVAAVVGENTAQGDGVFGIGHGVTGRGVVGTSEQQNGVTGISTGGTGVWATSNSGEAIHAITGSGVFAAIAGFNNNPNGTGAAIFGQKAGEAGDAGFFDGNVHVTKTLTVDLDAVINGSLRARVDVVLGNADCAEDFTVQSATEVEPGTVMVLTDAGTLAPATIAYDTRVTGVVSGAGTYRPALILDRIERAADRLPIALVGKVWCKADAEGAPISVGDLLTTSATPGHAMRASDRDRAFGAVLGKALGKLAAGHGLIPILVCLQ